MKAIALITNPDNDNTAQWQFDKTMAAIAYDFDLIVVFMPDAVKQLTHNKAWNSLNLYGIDDIYILDSDKLTNTQIIDLKSMTNIKQLSSKQLRSFIQNTDIIL